MFILLLKSKIHLDKSNPDVSIVKSSSPSKAIHRAVALHSFQAQSNRELPFKKGETFLVQRRINDDWLEGEHQGVTGIFPANHVELFPIESSGDETQGEAIVKFDFIPQKTFELQLRKGDKVTLLRRLNDNWYEGRLKNLEGIFPATYVETLREPKEQKVEKNRNSPPMLMRKCRVLYNYVPQNSDELEIHVGDIITIVEMCDDGWFCGLMENSKYTKKMEFGTFPGNYVELLPEEN